MTGSTIIDKGRARLIVGAQRDGAHLCIEAAGGALSVALDLAETVRVAGVLAALAQAILDRQGAQPIAAPADVRRALGGA